MNATQFASGLLLEADQIEEGLELINKRLVTYAVNSLHERTPKDTLYASENWNVSVGAIDRSTTGDVSPGRTLSEGHGVISGLTAYGVTFITNSVAYANRLENGHSAQAPNGMVAITYAEMSALSLGRLGAFN